MATPAQIQQAATDHLAAKLPGLSTCALYAGEFAGGEIARASVKSPAVLVACLSAARKADVDTGETEWTCRFAAYCLARHAGGREQRAVEALQIAEAVLGAVDGGRFGLTGVYPARATRIDNMYAAAIDRAGLALWAVTWEQIARLGTDEWADAGASAPEWLYVGISPDIGAQHKEDYKLINE